MIGSSSLSLFSFIALLTFAIAFLVILLTYWLSVTLDVDEGTLEPLAQSLTDGHSSPVLRFTPTLWKAVDMRPFFLYVARTFLYIFAMLSRVLDHTVHNIKQFINVHAEI